MNWKELLSAHLDGELSPEWRQKAERLLAESAAARQYASDLRRVDSDLRRVPDQLPSAASHANFRERAASELGLQLPTVPQTLVSVAGNAAPSRQIRQIRWIGGAGGVGVAAAAALLIALGAFWFSPPATDGSNRTPLVNQNQQPADSGNGHDVAVTPDPGYPDDAVLAALELLASDVDLEALAALDGTDLDILGNTEYLAMLESYDLTGESPSDDTERGN